MAGGTHVFDMIKRLRENENLRKLNYFKKREKSIKNSGPITIDPKSWTDDELKQLNKGTKSVNWSSLIRLIITFALLGLLTYLTFGILSE